MKRVAAYLRCSTAAQVERFSLPSQRREVEREAQRQGWTVAEWFTDGGKSGTSLERPEMRRLMAAVRAGKFDLVLTTEWSRLSRGDLGDWSQLLGAAREGGALLAVPGAVVDPRRASDVLIANLHGAVSAYEHSLIRERSVRGARERARGGAWTGRPAYGFKKSDSGHLEVLDEEAAVLRRAFDLAAAGASCLRIAATLSADGVRTRTGLARWSGVQVDRMLRSPAAIGESYFRGTLAKGGSDEEIRVANAHPAIVDAATFHRVNALLDARGRAGLPKSRWSSGYSLTGVLRCSCGGRMNGSTSKNYHRPGDKWIGRYYLCTESRRAAATAMTKPCKRLRAEPVEAAALELIASTLSNRAVLDAARCRMLEEKLRENTGDATRRAALEATIADAERRIRLSYEDRVAGVLTAAQFQSFNEEQLERQAAARAEIRDIEDRMLALGRHLDIERVVAQFRDMGRVLGALEPADLKALICDLVREVRVTTTEPTVAVAIAWRLPGFAEVTRGPSTTDARAASDTPRRRRARGAGGTR